MAEVTFGLDKNTGVIRHVSEVESGLRCNCYCLQCGKGIEICERRSSRTSL
jgi:hypothetical protein